MTGPEAAGAPPDPSGTSDGGSETAREDARGEVVERFAGHLTDGGMPRMAARVFACLVCEDTGILTAAELADRLQASPAAISGAVRYLSQVYLITRERQPGSRKERYRVEEDLWYNAMRSRSAMLLHWRETARQGSVTLGADSAAGRRLAETADFLEYLYDAIEQAVKSWHERDTPP